jgi:hypothetical protein
MTQIFDLSGDAPVVRSSIQVPADAKPPKISRTILVIDNFVAGEQRGSIEFVLDERFREQVDSALQELIDRANVFDPEKEQTQRDLSSALAVDENGSKATYASVLMKHDVFRPEQVNKIIDIEFREFV